MSSSQAEPLVHLSRVDFSIGERPILEDLNLDIRPGEFIGLLGPNGAGKTTLLKLILGLISPTSGQVHFHCEQEDCRLPDAAAGHSRVHPDPPASSCRPCIGYVPQHTRVFEAGFPATVREVVEMGLYGQKGLLHNLNATDRAQVDEAIAQAGLLALSTRRISELSGGQQQRVFIARALVGRPHLLILDEPTTGVDAMGEADFFRLLAHLNRTHHIAILLVLHEVEVLRGQVGRVIYLNRRILYDGPEKSLTGARFKELMGVPHV